MKITDITVDLLSYPLPEEHQWPIAKHKVVKADSIVVRVYTDAGIVGLGEPSPYGGPPEIKRVIEEHLKPRLIGQDPFQVEKLTIPGDRGPHEAQGLRGVPSGEDHRRNIAMAGIDQALWDIIGKAADTPVYRLLERDGDYVERLRVYASGGVDYTWWGRPERLVEEAVGYKEQGLTAFKMRIGTDWAASGVTVERFVKLLEKVREAVGPEMRLMLDGNMRFASVSQALEVAKELERLDFFWFEEPIPWNVDDYAALASQVEIPITGGESLFTRHQFKGFLDRGAYDIVQPDCNIAGISEVRRIADMAHKVGKHLCPHNWHNAITTAANAHLVASIPNRLVLEYNMTHNLLKTDILKDPWLIRDGHIDVPTKPGLGIELDEKALERFPYIEGPYAIPLQFPD